MVQLGCETYAEESCKGRKRDRHLLVSRCQSHIITFVVQHQAHIVHEMNLKTICITSLQHIVFRVIVLSCPGMATYFVFAMVLQRLRPWPRPPSLIRLAAFLFHTHDRVFLVRTLSLLFFSQRVCGRKPRTRSMPVLLSLDVHADALKEGDNLEELVLITCGFLANRFNSAPHSRAS
jgi:hypothetical protein